MSSITLNSVAICCLCIPCLISSVCAQTTDYKQWCEQTFGNINVMSAFTVKHVKTKVYVGL